METTDILESTMEITGETTPAFDEILTPGALAFVEKINTDKIILSSNAVNEYSL